MPRKKKPQPEPVTPDATASVPPEAMTRAEEPPPPAHHSHAANEPLSEEPSHAGSVRPDGPQIPKPFGYKQDAVAGVRLLEDRRFKQLQLKFREKPSEAVRAVVAEAGWRWRPHEEHWTKQTPAEKGWQTRAEADALYERVVTTIRAEMGVTAERG